MTEPNTIRSFLATAFFLNVGICVGLTIFAPRPPTPGMIAVVSKGLLEREPSPATTEPTVEMKYQSLLRDALKGTSPEFRAERLRTLIDLAESGEQQAERWRKIAAAVSVAAMVAAMSCLVALIRSEPSLRRRERA